MPSTKLFPLVLQKLGRQPGLILWVIKLSLSVYPYMYNRMTYGITHRRFEVFTIAFIVIARTRLARWRERIFATDPSSSSGKNALISLWGRLLRGCHLGCELRNLRSFSLCINSSVEGSVDQDGHNTFHHGPISCQWPDVRELKRLQDEAPATDWKDIRLPRKLLEQLTDINPCP
jgi:hypothetical protein